jgi:hypothetical protein
MGNLWADNARKTRLRRRSPRTCDRLHGAMILICLRSNPEINALSLSLNNLIGVLFDRARYVGDSNGICARPHVTLNLRRDVCEIVGLGMRIPDRDHHCRKYHGTQQSHCNPSRVAIQSRNCLEGAGQSHRQCTDFDGTDRGGRWLFRHGTHNALLASGNKARCSARIFLYASRPVPHPTLILASSA